jgi:hypothetical protein
MAIDLVDFQNTIHSQFGEDGIISKIFSVIGTSNKLCLEVGAGNGRYLSNTYLLEQQGWKRILIEKDPDLFAELSSWPQVNYTRLLHAEVGPDLTIDGVLDKLYSPLDIDFVCIDVDGDDYYIWDEITKFLPRVVMVEANSTFPFNVEFIQKRGEHIGSSALALYNLGLSKGYQLICYNVINCFFVRQDLFPNFDLKNKSFFYLYYMGLEDKPEISKDYDGRFYGYGKWDISGNFIRSDKELLNRASVFKAVNINDIR